MSKQPFETVGVALILMIALSCSAWETAGHRKVDLAFNRAIADGNLEDAKRLLEEGADINTRFALAGGYTNLSMVAHSTKDWPQGLLFLLENGADPDVRTNKSRTSLMIAISNENTEYVSILLAHGADPNIAALGGETALSIAEKLENAEIIRLLMEAGAGSAAS